MHRPGMCRVLRHGPEYYILRLACEQGDFKRILVISGGGYALVETPFELIELPRHGMNTTLCVKSRKIQRLQFKDI